MEDLYYELNCPILDLGTRSGWTDYIDFILLQESANYQKLFDNIDNFKSKYNYINSRSGREYMVTCYKK